MAGKRKRSRSRSASPSRLKSCGVKPSSKNELLCVSDSKLYKKVFSKNLEKDEKGEIMVATSKTDILNNISDLNTTQLKEVNRIIDLIMQRLGKAISALHQFLKCKVIQNEKEGKEGKVKLFETGDGNEFDKTDTIVLVNNIYRLVYYFPYNKLSEFYRNPLNFIDKARFDLLTDEEVDNIFDTFLTAAKTKIEQFGKNQTIMKTNIKNKGEYAKKLSSEFKNKAKRSNNKE